MRKLPLICVAVGLIACSAFSQEKPSRSPQSQDSRDGRHDFDWEFGTWNTHVRVLRNPLSGQAPNWAEYQGTSVVSPVLGGRFNLVELSVAGSAGEIKGASLRLYDPKARRWSLNYANARGGILTTPVYGTFDGHGRGIFFAHDTLDGRAILVRFLITQTSKTEARFVQSYSNDNGQTWETNWLAVDTRQ